MAMAARTYEMETGQTTATTHEAYNNRQKNNAISGRLPDLRKYYYKKGLCNIGQNVYYYYSGS